MAEKDYTGLVPENREGKEITAEANAIFKDEIEAEKFYNIARERLLNVNGWGKRAGSLSADFKLMDDHGNEVNGQANKGNYLRIDIPGPGSHAGAGYDWVVVEDIKEVNGQDVNSTAIVVRPASNPQTNNENIAHFYSEASTSTFEIVRQNNKVFATIYDRNIQANTNAAGAVDKIRNAIVGLGARHAASKLQWQSLAEAFVKKE